MTVKAPSVTSLRISKLSANQVQVRWDDVASVKVRSDFWFTRVEGERTPSMKTSVVEAIANDREQLKV